MFQINGIILGFCINWK